MQYCLDSIENTITDAVLAQERGSNKQQRGAPRNRFRLQESQLISQLLSTAWWGASKWTELMSRGEPTLHSNAGMSCLPPTFLFCLGLCLQLSTCILGNGIEWVEGKSHVWWVTHASNRFHLSSFISCVWKTRQLVHGRKPVHPGMALNERLLNQSHYDGCWSYYTDCKAGADEKKIDGSSYLC